LRPAHGAALGLGVAALLAALQSFGAFAAVDLGLVDVRFQLRGMRKASDRVALVEVDDTTISAFQGKWPLERQYYALLLEALREAGSAAIGLDVLFFGPGPVDPKYDALLATVTAATPQVVHSFMFPEEGQSGEEPINASPHDLSVLEHHGVVLGGDPLPGATTVALPYPALLEASPALGHVAVTLDSDGRVRRVPLFVPFQNRGYPALGVRLLATADAEARLPAVDVTGRQMRLRWPDGRQSRVPIDAAGTAAIDFAGDRTSFRHSFPLIQVLGWYRLAAGGGARAEEGRQALQQAFRGKIVLVGTTAVGESATDLGDMPFGRSTPLIYVHANLIDALLGGRFLWRPSQKWLLLCLGVLACALGALFAALPLAAAAGATFGALALLAISLQAVFGYARIEIPATAFLLLAPASYAAIATFRHVFLERRAREGEKELEAARTIQKRLLPSSPPFVRGLELFGTNIPAREVGGDYYDFVPFGAGRLAVALGDVSGKGVPAALLMSHLQASLHAEIATCDGPKDVLRAMDTLLYRATEPGRYATFFLACIEADGGGLSFCNAGHNPGLLLRAGAVQPLEATGVPLGMFEASAYAEQQHRFEPGDVLVLYSDGITEASWKGEFYGDDRLLAVVQRATVRAATAEQIGQTILDDVRRFAHGNLQGDDVTLVVVRRT
jgi:serine phosphatase RsbU (regulator of sigma subunit)